MILKKCRFIITQDDRRTILENKDLKINEETGILEEIGVNLTKESSEKIIDCSTYAVMPGFVNPHIHLFTFQLREDIINSWNELWDKARELEKNMFKLRMSWNDALSLITTLGFTTIAPTEICYGMFRENVNTFIEIIGGPFIFRKPDRTVGKIVHVSSILNIGPELFKELVDDAFKRNTMVSIHISNTRNEVFEFKRRYGKFPIEYLDSIGALRENVILVGLEWVTSWELRKIANSTCKVVLIPSCSMLYALGGLPPIIEFIREKITLGLGTCSLTCNSPFMFHEAKALLYYIRTSYWSFKLTAQQVLDIMTLGNTRILNVKGGTISEGEPANLAIINLKHGNLTPASIKNIIQNIILYSEPYNIEFTVVKGKLYSPRKNILGKVFEKFKSLR